MYKKEITITNASGLHARPASDFVRAAKSFASAVTIRKTDGGEAVNAKSMMRVLSLAVSKGTKIELSAEGEDETAAVDSLVKMIEEGFGE